MKETLRIGQIDHVCIFILDRNTMKHLLLIFLISAPCQSSMRHDILSDTYYTYPSSPTVNQIKYNEIIHRCKSLVKSMVNSNANDDEIRGFLARYLKSFRDDTHDRALGDILAIESLDWMKI